MDEISAKNSNKHNSTKKDVNRTISEALNQSEDINKRTNLGLEKAASNAAQTRQLQPINQNNQVIETVLPSGPRSQGPQHIGINNQPTHILFKPVHKYYPAIHRYMTKPIHRYLSKPLSLNGLIPNSRLLGETQPAQSRQQAAVSPAPQSTAPIPLQLQLQDSTTTKGNTGTTATTTTRPPAPGNVKQVSPIRIFASLPPRMQPVLLHPHKLSPTGKLL